MLMQMSSTLGKQTLYSCLISHRLWPHFPPTTSYLLPRFHGRSTASICSPPFLALPDTSAGCCGATIHSTGTCSPPSCHSCSSATGTCCEPPCCSCISATACAHVPSMSQCCIWSQKAQRQVTGNQGTQRGGAGVGKTCQACSVIEGKPVQLIRAHQNTCIYCTKCVVKSKGNDWQLKMVNGVPHNCPHK